jgi:hypothetical protein
VRVNTKAFVAAAVMLASLTPGGSLQSQDTALPLAAAAIVLQMEKDIAATKAKTVVALDKVLKDTTKKGDLAGAVAINEVIEQLRAESLIGQQRATGRANAMAGRWAAGSVSFDFMPDGSASSSSGLRGAWQYDGKTLLVKWTNGYTYRLTATPDGLVGVQINQGGTESAFRLTRGK